MNQNCSWFVVVCSGFSFAESTPRCDIVVFPFRQKGDEGEEGVTSEGRTTLISFSLIFQPHFDHILLSNSHSSYSFLQPFLFSSFHLMLPEFDKFLEERAKAAEAVPSLPSPPSGDPGAVQGTPSRKKPERPEDTLLAM